MHITMSIHMLPMNRKPDLGAHTHTHTFFYFSKHLRRSRTTKGPVNGWAKNVEVGEGKVEPLSVQPLGSGSRGHFTTCTNQQVLLMVMMPDGLYMRHQLIHRGEISEMVDVAGEAEHSIKHFHFDASLVVLYPLPPGMDTLTIEDVVWA